MFNILLIIQPKRKDDKCKYWKYGQNKNELLESRFPLG